MKDEKLKDVKSTFTNLVLSVDGVFGPQMNSFSKDLTDWLVENTFLEYAKVKSWTKKGYLLGLNEPPACTYEEREDSLRLERVC